MQATELQNKKCIPCQGGTQPLAGEDLQEFARALSDWQVVDDHHITRTFTFDNFRQALAFVNRVGNLAEDQGHHPDISFTWGKATIELHTHKIDGLSEADFIMAAKIDALID